MLGRVPEYKLGLRASASIHCGCDGIVRSLVVYIGEEIVGVKLIYGEGLSAQIYVGILFPVFVFFSCIFLFFLCEYIEARARTQGYSHRRDAKSVAIYATTYFVSIPF
ncbi:hypothetical protein BDV26DRAFT_276664 [Aspergillus bertholletiae]|uniref:Uncharacterized protein n=1 Tax=Aspergillus bertholletiae TaxID=1226010 RepID=A0A5N7AMQ7_9EURO|nr:hypothetical protein BDV26DRAFT_276664 [Aspergillus bertholletiae]